MTGATSLSSPAGRASALRVPVTAGRAGHAAGPDGLQARMRGGVVTRAGHRSRRRVGQAGQLACGQRLDDAVARPSVPQVPGFRLVIGVEGDPRAWVRVANALLDRIASGAVRAGSRVPPVTALGLEAPVPPGAAARAFCALAEEGVLCWVPGRGYFVRTRFTVPVSGRARADGGLTAVLPGEGRQQQAGYGTAASEGARRR